MQAGQELDRLIAEKVLGHHKLNWVGEMPKDAYAPYSTDIAAAWAVHQHCCQQLFSKRMNYLDALGFLLQTECRSSSEGAALREAFPSAIRNLSPLLICQAALKAMEDHANRR